METEPRTVGCGYALIECAVQRFERGVPTTPVVCSVDDKLAVWLR